MVPARLNLVVSIVAYMCASAGMSIFNKLAVVHLPLPLTIVAIQMAFTVGTILLNPKSITFGSWQDVRRWGLTVPALFVGMLASSMIAMKFSSLGTIVVCRNVAPIPTMLIEGMFRVPFVLTGHTVGALLVIVGGVAAYEYDDLAFSVAGIVSILINMTFAVLERLMQRHLMANQPVDLSKPMMMLLNNGVGMLPCLLLAVIAGEAPRWGPAFGSLDSRAALFLVASCVNGVCISYTGLRLQQMVAATTFMVITNVNKFAVILFGILAFGEAATPLSLVGCTAAILGGVYYAEARKRAVDEPHKQSLSAPPTPLGNGGAERSDDEEEDDPEDSEAPMLPK